MLWARRVVTLGLGALDIGCKILCCSTKASMKIILLINFKIPRVSTKVLPLCKNYRETAK